MYDAEKDGDREREPSFLKHLILLRVGFLSLQNTPIGNTLPFSTANQRSVLARKEEMKSPVHSTVQEI